MERPKFYFDKRGIEIKEGDILKFFHFQKSRRSSYYMWKVAIYDERLGWRGMHTGSAFKDESNTFNLGGTDPLLRMVEIISRDACFEHQLKTGERERMPIC